MLGTYESNPAQLTSQKVWDAIVTAAEELSKEWYKRQAQNPYASLYIYYKPSTSYRWGEIIIAEDTEDPREQGYILADPRRVPPA